MTDEDELRLEGETEAEATRRVMGLSRWTLNQTIAWIATRNPSALLQGLGSIGLSVWMAFEKVSGRKTDYPFARYEDAWEELASSLADGQLAGIATQTKGSKLGGRFDNALGVRFPPTDQPGFALGCSVFDSDRTGGEPVIAPTDRIFGVEWDEFHDLTFRREEIQKVFPPSASVAVPNGATTKLHSQFAPLRCGAPAKYDWDTYELLFFERVEKDGVPEPNNVEGWRTQADVARFFQSLAEKDKVDMEWESAKKRAQKVCAAARG